MKDIDRGVGEGLRKNKVFPNSDSDAKKKQRI